MIRLILNDVQESWSEYKNMRLLEVSKSRWPEAKVRLWSMSSRYLELVYRTERMWKTLLFT